MCIYSVKSVAKFFFFHLLVYTCFLYTNKAFDRINHWTVLHTNCQKRTMHSSQIRIMMFWHRTQTVCVNWGKLSSSYFSVSTEVTEGGILSFKPFFVYVDDLLVALSGTKTGLCYYSLSDRTPHRALPGSMCTNILELRNLLWF